MKRVTCTAMIIPFALVGLWACAPRYLESELAPDATLYVLSRIAVLPVAAADAAGAAEPYRSGRVAAGADAVMTDLLYGALAERPSLELAARGLVEQELDALPRPPTPSALQALARKLQADAVLKGLVTDYREREGSHVGVERPAAVGIELSLIAARDGRTIWSARYYESQQSMTEDPRTLALYWKRGTRWLTAAELAKYAIAELVKTLPPPRTANPSATP